MLLTDWIYPEYHLLLCCGKTLLTDDDKAMVYSVLKENVNWDNLISLAHQHGLTSLLYWNLHQTYPKLVPDSILEQLKEHFYANISYNLTLTNELLKVLTLFQSHSISAIPFKGAVLAVSLYKNIGLREFGDLDILVHKKDFFQAKNLLENQGYQPRRRKQQNDYKARFYVDFQNELELIHPDYKIVVDLHCHISPLRFSGYPPIQYLWNATETFSLLGTPVLTFKPEAQLLLLCLNGSKENWEKLSRLYDIAALLQSHTDIDWDLLINNTQKWGSQRIIYIGLFLVNKLLLIEIPQTVKTLIQQDLESQSISQRLYEQFSGNHDIETKSIKRFLCHWHSRNSWKSQLQYVLLSGIYYPIRSLLGVKH